MMDNNKHTMHDRLLEGRREHTLVKPTTLARPPMQVRQHSNLQHNSARNLLHLSTEHILVKNSKHNTCQAMVNLRTDSQHMVAQKAMRLAVLQQLMDNSNRRHPTAEHLLEEDIRLLSKGMLLVVLLQSLSRWGRWDLVAARNNLRNLLLPVHLCN